VEGARVVGMRFGTIAHSAYNVAGLSTSGARSYGWPGENERYLNGVGRKSACSVDCGLERRARRSATLRESGEMEWVEYT
jgi:hypothetical protein